MKIEMRTVTKPSRPLQGRSMTEHHRRLARAIITTGALFTIFACESRALDLGSSAPDAAEDVVGEVEAGRYDVGALYGLVVDGVTCTVTDWSEVIPESRGREATMTGQCPALGRVRVALSWRDDVAFPQRCGAPAKVAFATESDASVLAVSHRADGTAGSCVYLGGSQVEATVASDDGSEHRLLLGNSDFVHGGGGATRTEYLTPGPGRPSPVACKEDAGQCAGDQDCADGVPCLCSSIGICMTGSTCATDGDCAAGQRCALSLLREPTERWPLGYFCTTPGDACTCVVPAASPDGAFVCAYDATALRWGCHAGL